MVRKFQKGDFVNIKDKDHPTYDKATVSESYFSNHGTYEQQEIVVITKIKPKNGKHVLKSDRQGMHIKAYCLEHCIRKEPEYQVW